MTISTTANRNDYTGDGCTTAFAYTYKILANTDLDVFIDNCQKLLTTDYTVTGVGAETGGTVTFVTAPSCNLAVAIVRDIPYTQSTEYPESGPFPTAAHEDALDKLTMLVQQIKELATRSWRFAAGSPKAATGYTVPEPVASKFVRIKADCSGVDYVALEACGTYVNPITTKGDLLVGTDASQERLGITLGYTLAGDPNTGKPSWQPGLSVQLTNKLDAALTAGDVVALDTACDRAVVAADAQGCVRVFVVAPATVGDDCLALFHYSGLIRNVKAQGTIARGTYVRKSSTAQAVESSEGVMGVVVPPAGAIGVAATAAAGGLVDVIFWGTPSAGPTDRILDLSPCTALLAAGCSPLLVANYGLHGQDTTLDFDNDAEACATWEHVIPPGLTLRATTLYVQSRQKDSCSGTVGWIFRSRVVDDGDTWDAAYSHCQAVTAVNVKATVGQVLNQCLALVLTGWSAGKRLRVKLLRDVHSDSAGGRTKFIGGQIRLE